MVDPTLSQKLAEAPTYWAAPRNFYHIIGACRGVPINSADALAPSTQGPYFPKASSLLEGGQQTFGLGVMSHMTFLHMLHLVYTKMQLATQSFYPAWARLGD